DNDNQERKPNMLFIVDINTKTVIGTYDIDQRFHCKAQLDRANRLANVYKIFEGSIVYSWNEK
ncbi:MAG: hypothetical protein V3U02_12515, partial [Calditrichia bacterium]